MAPNALELDFTVKQQTSCTEILFTDLTGDYSDTNPGGWGFPNIQRGFVSVSTLTVITPSGVTYIIDITENVINDTPIVITNDQLGGTANSCMSDGQYYMSWFVLPFESLTGYTKESYFFFDCGIACKVASLFTNLDLTNCNPCNETLTSKISNALLAWAYLEALRNAACCGKTELFANILTTLERMVDDSQCTSCG
jgi:hypothetical protein